MDRVERLQQGLTSAFVNHQVEANLAFKPQFVSNNYKEGRKVLTTIEEELLRCEEFSISVAFITKGGLVSLLQTLKELESRGIRGRILTTDYQTFTDPWALDKLYELDNIELKMYYTEGTEEGFHTKGYIFKQEEIYRIIVGSANMTAAALTQNAEWNTKLVSTEQGEVAIDILQEFNNLWNSELSKDYEDVIDLYRIRHKQVKKQKKLARQNAVVSLEQYTLQPNKMQLEFINNVRKIRGAGKDRALLISATGTGKTYASAFALRDHNPKKALFLVHREQIAKQAMKSYKRVFGNTKTFGLLSGNAKDYEADYLFSTMQMMVKPEVLKGFLKTEFDTIVIDEVHRAGSDSYQNIMEYFTPNFWLGMTASPERTDGFDIYGLFEHNIAYEIRLQQALEENLLCPFHYFGITDLEINGQVFDDNSGMRNFSSLVSDARVDYVLEKASYYGYSGERVKGLVFCSRKEEAKELSAKFNAKGLHTEFLCGRDSQEKREECIERLTNDEREDRLDYIFTVDIFNEGVDIPEINQVIMLRPTESPIVFIQQLGRGLRKSEGKEYVVILDFIGNYTNNFMIPIALSGDRSYNKDSIRKYLTSGNNVIPGASTIHFDEISKNRIFHSIDSMKGIKKIIKTSYQNLKFKLGRIPYLMDFYREGEVDPIVILDNYKTYHAFLECVEAEYRDTRLKENEIATLEYLSRLIANGKRPHELLFLKSFISKERVEKREVQEQLRRQYDIYASEEDLDSVIQVLEGKFVNKDEELKRYEHIEIVGECHGQTIHRMASLYERMNGKEFSNHMEDLIELGLQRYQDIYGDKVRRRGVFTLYEKYSRRDVCQLLNWGKDFSSTIYGMKRIKDNVCIFVTYDKVVAADEQEYLDGKPDYADQFVNNQTFMWDSQMGKDPDSSYMQDVKEAMHKHLFIKKSDAEGSDFYYMGEFDIVHIQSDKKKDKNGKLKDIAKVELKMHDLVREDLFKYLTTPTQES